MNAQFDPYQLFISWLYVPHDKMNIADVVRMGKEYGVPLRIIFNKYAVYLKNKHKTNEEIKIELLKYYDVVEELLIPELREVSTPTPKEMYNALQLMGPFKKKSTPVVPTTDIKHSDYPEIDPIAGRPHINWIECFYKGCHKKFKDTMQFKKHLEDNKVFTPRFHKSHEEIVEQTDLTEDFILSNRITKCPSLICDNKNHKNPDDLIHHFVVLGIKPFWKQGMAITGPTDNTETTNVTKSDKVFIGGELQKVYSVESCIVCFERKPFVMFVDCCHHICCLECFTQSKPRTCFICHGVIRFIVPY